MQTSKTTFRSLAGKLLPVVLSAALLPDAAVGAQILRYSDHEPLGGMRTRFLRDVFFDALEKESSGRLQVEPYWDAQLSSGYDALRTVGAGKTADMAIVVPEYMAADLPLHQLFKSYPTGPAGADQVEFFRRVYREIPEFVAELANNNAVPVLLSTGYPVAFFSTQPIDHLREIQGHSWRTASFWHRDFLRNAGAKPVQIPWGEEVYQALGNKTLDGLMVNIDSGYMLKVYKAAPNVLTSKRLWLGHLYILAMNRETWDALAEEDQQAVQRAAATAYRELGRVMERSYTGMLDALRQQGANVQLINEDAVDNWQRASRYTDVQAKWVAEQKKSGNLAAEDVLEQLDAIMDDTLQAE